MRNLFAVLILLTVAAPASAQLANSYPNDVGICGDAQVVWCEQFDDTLGAVLNRWTGSSSTSDTFVTGATGQSHASTQMALSTDTPLGTGTSLRTRVTGGSFTTVQLSRNLEVNCPAPCNELWFRAYLKYTGPQPHHHAGLWVIGQNPKSAFLSSTCCDRPTGTDRFYIGMEPGSANTPPSWDLYTGWMEMRDSPGGNGVDTYFGNTFINDVVTMTFGGWHMMEVRVKMNTVGQADGEMQAWLDGQEIINLTTALHGDFGVQASNIFTVDAGSPNTFPGFRWRSTAALELSKIWLNHYSDLLPGGQIQDIFWDHIVVAKTRVGPINTGGGPTSQNLFIRFTDQQPDGTNQETGFKVNRKAGTGGVWVPLTTAPPSPGSGAIVTVNDPTAPVPTACYQVAATNSAGDSAYLGGDAGVCRTLGVAPTAPCCLIGCLGPTCTP